MKKAKQHRPVIVSTGVLAQSEYAALAPRQREIVDAAATAWVAQYGAAGVRQQREALLDELAFYHGI